DAVPDWRARGSIARRLLHEGSVGLIRPLHPPLDDSLRGCSVRETDREMHSDILWGKGRAGREVAKPGPHFLEITGKAQQESATTFSCEVSSEVATHLLRVGQHRDSLDRRSLTSRGSRESRPEALRLAHVSACSGDEPELHVRMALDGSAENLLGFQEWDDHAE